MIPDGIYPQTTTADYYGPEWAGRMSPSILEHGVEGTMAHVKAAFDGAERADTDALAFGRAFHSALLEPTKFKTDYAVVEQCQAETAKKQRCSRNGTVRVGGQWYCSTHIDSDVSSDVEVISESDMSEITAMRTKVFAHPAVALMRNKGDTECCIAWTANGVPCKSRLDKLCMECQLPDDSTGPMILDLKTVRSANPLSIRKAIEEHGWARAAAMRIGGIEALTGKHPDYCLICIEKEPPYQISVPCTVLASEDDATRLTMCGAAREVHDLLCAWAACVKSGNYPGYPEDFSEMRAPEWKLKQYDYLLERGRNYDGPNDA